MLDLLFHVTTVLTVVLTACPDPITFIWATMFPAARHISSVLASVKLDSRSSRSRTLSSLMPNIRRSLNISSGVIV